MAFTEADAAAAFHLDDNLLARYPFGEDAGTTAADVAGGHPLALTGGAGWSGGVGGSGLNLSGAAFASTTGAVVDTSARFSVSAWVNLASVSGFATAVGQDGAQASGFYLQYAQQDNAWAFAMTAADAANATAVRAVSPFPPKTGDWTHLVGIYDAGARATAPVRRRATGRHRRPRRRVEGNRRVHRRAGKVERGERRLLAGPARPGAGLATGALSDADVRALV